MGLELLQHILVLLAFLMFFSYIQVATAAETPVDSVLLLEGRDKQSHEMILPSSSELEMRITGVSNTATLTQHFYNPYPKQISCVYLFALHSDAILEQAMLHADDQIFQGEVDATTVNTSSSILTRKHYRINGLSLEPYEHIEIRLTYRQSVKVEKNQFQLVVALPHPEKTNLHVELDAGFPVAEILSPTHDIHTTRHGQDRYSIRLKDNSRSSMQELKLIWLPEAGYAPQTVPQRLDTKNDFSAMKTSLIQQAGEEPLVYSATYPVMVTSLKLWLGLLCVCLILFIRGILNRFYSGENGLSKGIT
jgi:hypothetical protein